MTACSFTGHRVIPSGEVAHLLELLDRAIHFAYSKGIRTFNCGGALGFDTLAARAVLKKREECPDVRLVLILPCTDQARLWNRGDVEVYNSILDSADEKIYVSEEYTRDCMRKRNARLAEECDMLIAYVGRERSGAGQTVRIAEALGKEVYNLMGKR